MAITKPDDYMMSMHNYSTTETDIFQKLADLKKAINDPNPDPNAVFQQCLDLFTAQADLTCTVGDLLANVVDANQ